MEQHKIVVHISIVYCAVMLTTTLIITCFYDSTSHIIQEQAHQ